jgi:hypothetical protein
MKRFKDTNLTDAEWKEVFSFPKDFNEGDLVECGRSVDLISHPAEFVWKVVATYNNKGDEIIYQLRGLVTNKLEWFSSTFIQPLGTFVDTEVFTKGVR